MSPIAAQHGLSLAQVFPRTSVTPILGETVGVGQERHVAGSLWPPCFAGVPVDGILMCVVNEGVPCSIGLGQIGHGGNRGEVEDAQHDFRGEDLERIHGRIVCLYV